MNETLGDDGRIQLGIVGGGGVGKQTLKLAQSLDEVAPVAVAEPDAAARSRLEEEFGIPAYAELEAMLAEVRLDAVKICTPNFLHAEQAAACLEAGLHVLCEKPLATTVADGEKVLAAAREAGRVFMVNFEYRQSLLFERIRELIRSGAIGAVAHIHFHEWRGAFGKKQADWVFDKQKSGGFFVEKLCHYIDLACWFADAHPRRVHAFAGPNTLPHYAVADNANAVFEMDDGVLFHITEDHAVAAHPPRAGGPAPPATEQWTRLGHGSGFRIAGDRGSLVSDDWWLTLCVNRLEYDTRSNHWRLAHERVEDLSAYPQQRCIHNQQGMLAHFVATCRAGGACIEPDPETLRAVLRASVAAEEALETRRPADVKAGSTERPG